MQFIVAKRGYRVLPLIALAIAAALLVLLPGDSRADHGSPFIDLTITDNTVDHNDALFVQGGLGAGTGNFDPFLTLNAGGSTPTEQGYNTTSASGEFDTFFGGGRTHPLKASAVPVIDVGGTLYREFLLDYNETGAEDFVSIDVLKFYLDNQNNLTDYTDVTNQFGSDDDSPTATLIYNMDGGGDTVLMMCTQSCSSGSGVSDISVLLPDSIFPADCYYGSLTCDDWIYLYFAAGGYVEGSLGVDPVPGTQNWGVTGGFEEWRTELIPVVNVTKTANVSYTVTYDWTLVKEVSLDCATNWVDAASVAIQVGSSQDYCWRLVATRGAGVVSQQVVSGTVTITNPTGGTVITDDIPANISSIVDSINFDDATTDIPNVALNCPQTPPFTLGAGDSIVCTYSVAAPGAVSTTTGTNTVTVQVEDAATDFEATDTFDFGDATVTEIDESATLSDPEVITPDQLISASQTFVSSTQTYTCGETTTIVNSGQLTENDSGQTRTDSAQITITCVDARISIETSDTNQVNDAHTFTVTVEKNDGTGWSPAVGVNVLASETGIGSITGGTCDNAGGDTDASGQCTIIVNSATPGSSTVNASATVNVLGVVINVATDGYGAFNVSNVKTWVDARISIATSDTNQVNDAHTFTVTVEKNDGTGWAPVVGVNVLASETGVGSITGGTCDNAGGDTDASGQCTIIVNSATPGSSTVNASATVTIGPVNINVATDGYGAFNVSNVKTWVDARISIATSDTNQVNDAHTFTVTVEKNDGTGWAPAAGVNVLASETGVGSITGGTCDNAGGDTDASGQCTIIVNSATPGSSTVNASATVTIGPVNINVATDGYGAFNVSNVKTWVDARISIATSDTNQVNDAHTFTVTVEKNDGTGWAPAAGVNVLASETGVGSITGGTCDNAGGDTDASGQCTIIVNSATPGSSTVNASATVTIGPVNINVATDGYGAFNVSNVKTWVDARISIETSDTNGITEPHTFMVTVEKNDGTGWAPAAGVNVLASETGVGSITGGTCDNAGGDTDASGQCTIIVNSSTAGSSTVNASASVSVGGINVNVATDGYGAFNVSNVKTWVDGSLRWIKHDQFGQLLAGATFEVCRTHTLIEDVMTDTADVCFSVTDNSPPDTDPTGGEFQLDGLILGRYTVRETAAPPGYLIVNPNPVTAPDMSEADPDVEISEPFVNTVPGQGCTPGWWKNQGLSAWNQASDTLAQAVADAVFAKWGIVIDGTTNSLFRSAFNLTAGQMQGLNSNLTLLQAIQLGGGNFAALARQGTAALLNSLSVNYPYSADQVLQLVHDAFVSGNLGTLVTDFDTANNLSHEACPTG